jgi:hypothetical protein
VQLPNTFRAELLDAIDQLFAVSSPGSEALTQCFVDLFEAFGEDHGIDDILSSMEDSGELDGPFQESLENEFITNENFHDTGEDAVSVVEQFCAIEWIDEADFDELDILDEDDY